MASRALRWSLRAGPVTVALLVAVFVAAVLLVAVVDDAKAYTNECSSEVVWDPDVCERTEAIAVELAAQADKHELVARGVWFLAGAVLLLMIAPMLTAAFRFWRD